MGQGQLRVITYINFVELEYILLHAKFHDQRNCSSVGEDLMNVLTINEHGCHLTLSHVTIYINFLTTFQGGST